MLRKRRRHIRQEKLVYKEGIWVKNEDIATPKNEEL
jgi:hypothetical protein